MRNYRHFGVMLDCSRNAVMSVGAVKKFIDYISLAGYDTLELYMEDVYEVKNEPYFGYMRGRYSIDELKSIDEYATAKGVKLIPAVQTLAHFTNLVKLEKYHGIVDVNDILLIDDDRTYDFIDNLFAALAGAFTSREVNIGMDEAHMVGLGKYLDLHGYTDRNELLLRHLKKVCGIAAKYGFTAHMWSDMFFRIANGGEYYGENPKLDAKSLSEMPDNVEPVYWDYYHTDEKNYDDMFAAHKKFNRNVWFAGGAWCWAGFAPFNGFTLKSMGAAMKSVAENDVKDVIITMWGDDGKECSFFSLLPSLFAVRRFADGCFDYDVIKADFKKTYGLNFDDFILLDTPNELPNPVGGIENPCKALLYSDPFMGFYDDLIEKRRNAEYDKKAKNLKDAALRSGEFGYIFESLSALCSVLDIKYDLGMRIRRAYRDKDCAELGKIVEDMRVLSDRLNKFYTAFAKLWFTENKPFGFEVQEARLGGLMLRIRSCRERIENYIHGKIESVPELEEDILPYGAAGNIMNSSYRRLVSPDEI